MTDGYCSTFFDLGQGKGGAKKVGKECLFQNGESVVPGCASGKTVHLGYRRIAVGAEPIESALEISYPEDKPDQALAPLSQASGDRRVVRLVERRLELDAGIPGYGDPYTLIGSVDWAVEGCAEYERKVLDSDIEVLGTDSERQMVNTIGLAHEVRSVIGRRFREKQLAPACTTRRRRDENVHRLRLASD